MPDRRAHRGQDPEDPEAFGPAAIPALRHAVADLSWLLEREYSMVSSVKLVGDRWTLTERQRLAIRRAACSDSARASRLSRRIASVELRGANLVIDGFNVVTTVESALGGGVILHGRDETFRDIAGIHGTYRRVAETLPALELLGAWLSRAEARQTRWLFDRPVSNSGRIAAMVEEHARERGWNWTAELLNNPDGALREARCIIATADSAVLDTSGQWLNLAREVVEATCPDARIIDLSTLSSIGP